MKYLGLDVGAKRVGVAVSDDGGTVAFPLAVVSLGECVSYVAGVVRERGVAVVVVGESLDLDGGENEIMKEIRAVADALREFVQVAFAPEQFSTQAAGRLGKGSDAEAAAVILQGYLDRLRGGGDEEIDFD